ncbi:LacI family DNA-binding transcriptional regulator [Microbacterium horticulturae]|uniref:LacI family DNA-binding transcriptional regulator n=1 Tax=Microbacterium horticulturae TaxID=3028316 RepID=A0ABY8C699_9MICO|nr:LacI family DNA-binding transcriptional regulator [Microbacterium sp. KACC 23027]WEG10606.1 LacI family DNA-binding transcriptional regulator [Microbacterium sp. KACC 23027]
MADVAARAGVSGQTVSRVVNGSPRVDPGTRERVEAAMEELGYRMHRAARALRTGRTQTIGLVATTLATVGNSRMLQAVADAAASRGYALVVVTLGADAIDVAFERLRDQGVDGAVVLNEATVPAQGAAVPDDLHLVVVDAPAADRFDVVQTAHALGAQEATRHLLGLGHRTVHHLAGPAGSFSADERERGWRAALAEAGAETPEPLRGDWTAASGHLRGRELPADATAVFAANDQMALGLLRALASGGRRVPEDVSVVGFDDVADAADYRPPLTTVRQDFDALGARAVDVLVSRIEAPAAPQLAVIPAHLVVRDSSGLASR